MNKLILLPIILFFGCKSIGHFQTFHPEDYYDEFHFYEGGSLLAYTKNYKSYEVKSEDLINNYLNVEILNIAYNLNYFIEDEEGIYLLHIDKHKDSIPRGLDFDFIRVAKSSICQKTILYDYSITTLLDLNGDIINNEKARLEVLKRSSAPEEIEEYELELRIDTIPYSLLDTIVVIRNPPKEESKRTFKEDKENPYYSDNSKKYEIFELVTLDKSNPDTELYKDYLVNVQIELKEGDLYSESEPLLREIFSPRRITDKMIQALSIHLQELGYLTSNGNSYIPDVMNAIHQLQLDNKLPTGFLDDKTFGILKLNFEDHRSKYENGKIVCVPGKIRASYK